MSRYTRAEHERALSIHNEVRGAHRTVKEWRAAGGGFLAPEQVRIRHCLA